MGLTIPIEGAAYPGDRKVSHRVAMGLVVQNPEDKLFHRVDQALDIRNTERFLSASSLVVSNNTFNRTWASMSLAVSHTTRAMSNESLLVGTTKRDVAVQSVEALKGDGFLILADIVSGLVSQETEALNNIQVIDLGGATGGTWSAWLTYGGYILDTETLPFNATASNVKDAFDALPTVPNLSCIVVTGANGGPFTVEFTDAMGHRFISPLIIDILNLTGSTNPGTTVVVPGRPIGSFSRREVTAELKINGQITDFKNFQYQQPMNKLGALLNIALSTPDKNLVPFGADIEFALVASIGDQTRKKVLLKNGKMTGRDYRMAYRAGVGIQGGTQDEVSFSSIDVVADKFSLAPRRPIIMYDPLKVNFSNVEIRPRDMIVDSAGLPILPVYEPINGLSMYNVLTRAYTAMGGYAMRTVLSPDQLPDSLEEFISSPTNDQVGLGFSNVITNIDDYTIKQANFGIEGGFHAGANPFVGIYNPEYFPFGNTLYVLNTEFPLPFGHVPRIITMERPKSFTETLPFKPDSNAVLVTYQVSAALDDAANTVLGSYYLYETDNSEDGLQETMTRTRFLTKTDIITAERIAEVPDEIFIQIRTDFGDGFKTLSHEETQQNFYHNDLKIGHRKDVSTLILGGDGRSAFVTPILRETNECIWDDDPANLGMKIMARSITRVTGLVYELVKTVPKLNPASGLDEDINVTYPLVVAQASNMLGDPDFEGAVSESFRPIETTTETLRHLGGNQYDVEVITIDEINKSTKRSLTSPRTGDTSTNPYEFRSKTMLRRDLTSEAAIGPRIPISINAGELPRDRALALADLTLFRLANPLGTFKMPLLEVDFGIEKGTVVVGQTRYGYTNRHVVVGIDISGEMAHIIMSLDAKELPI